MKKEIPIFFTIDDNYAMLAACAINSLRLNSSKENSYNIYVIYTNLNLENQKKLKALETENVKISFKDMQEKATLITDRKENRLRCDYFTLTIYLRLFIADMFPSLDKAIYIDSDIVLLEDIANLYNIDLKDNIIGACPDYSIQDVPELVSYVENAIGVNRLEYINSGVLLMNLKMMREKGLANKFLDLLNTYHFDTIAPDQDYLNAMCNGKILYLDQKWDAMPNDCQEELSSPALVHYNLFQKPWCYDNIQYADYFWKYAKDCGYYEEIINFKTSYSEEKKKSDAECLKTLVGKGASIPNNDLTFKKIYEKNNKIRI